MPHRKVKRKRTRAKTERQDVVPLREVRVDTPEAWASGRWRDWRNAVVLCLDIHRRWFLTTDDNKYIERLLLDAVKTTSTENVAGIYSNLMEIVNTTRPYDVDGYPLEVGIAIARLGLAKSDGGGMAFSERLGRLFRKLWTNSTPIESLVRAARLRDAFWDAQPNVRRAFTASWDAEMYEAAFAIVERFLDKYPVNTK